jgi:26S proteasome regulatory subunit N8
MPADPKHTEPEPAAAAAGADAAAASGLPDLDVVVHPLVLLSVVDHYNRVAKDTKKRAVSKQLVYA